MKRIIALLLCGYSMAAFAGDVISPLPGSGNYSGASVGTSSMLVVPSGQVNQFLDIINVSASATVCCALGAAATISGTQCAAGEIYLPPGWHRSYEGTYVPKDSVNCISSAASTPMTIGVK